MKTKGPTMKTVVLSNRACPHSHGFTLIEMIGVVAIIAIVAAILTPNLARRISRANGEKEDQVLTVLADGLIQYTRANQSISGPNAWVTNISTQTGLPLNEVRYVNPSITTNARVYLIHPSFAPTNAPGTDPLWAQTTSGATNRTRATRFRRLRAAAGPFY